MWEIARVRVGENGFIDVCYISFSIKGKITRPFEFGVYIHELFGGGLHVLFLWEGRLYIS